MYQQKTLEKYLLSKYREGNYYPIDDPGQPEEAERVSSDKTEIYWLLDVPEDDNKKSPKRKPVKVFNIHAWYSQKETKVLFQMLS